MKVDPEELVLLNRKVHARGWHAGLSVDNLDPAGFALIRRGRWNAEAWLHHDLRLSAAQLETVLAESTWTLDDVFARRDSEGHYQPG